MNPDFRTFQMKRETPRRWLKHLIVLIWGLGLMLPVIAYSINYWGELVTFCIFLFLGISFGLIFEYWFHAKTLVTTQVDGLTIEVIRSGLGMSRHSEYHSWEQLKGFKYALFPRRGYGINTIFESHHCLILQWVDGTKIRLLHGEVEAFYAHLMQICPEKKMAHWTG